MMACLRSSRCGVASVITNNKTVHKGGLKCLWEAETCWDLIDFPNLFHHTWDGIPSAHSWWLYGEFGDAEYSSGNSKSSSVCCCFFFCLFFFVCVCVMCCLGVSVMIQVFPLCSRCENIQQRKEPCLKLSKLRARWNTTGGWKEGREEQKETVSQVVLLSVKWCCLQRGILALKRLLVEWDEKWSSLF